MKVISLKEIKLIHSRNNILNEKIDEMNNFKKTYSYKTINLKGYPKTKFLLNLKKANSILWKKPFLSNLIDVNNKTQFNKQHSFNFRYITQKIPSKFSLYTILAIYLRIWRIIMEWAEKVSKLMKQRGLNQKQLSKKSGITESSISRYLEGNKIPRMDVVVNIARALEVETSFFLDEDDCCESAYTAISTAIARNGKNLNAEEKNKLISLLIGDQNV